MTLEKVIVRVFATKLTSKWLDRGEVAGVDRSVSGVRMRSGGLERAGVRECEGVSWLRWSDRGLSRSRG